MIIGDQINLVLTGGEINNFKWPGADRVLIDAHAQSRTTAKDVFYVALSRARFEATVYTNNKDALPKAITRNNLKFAALDLSGKAYCR